MDDRTASEILHEQIMAWVESAIQVVVASVDEPDLIDGGEMQLIVSKTINDLAIERRVKMHASAWIDDVEVYAGEVVRTVMNDKLKAAVSA